MANNIKNAQDKEMLKEVREVAKKMNIGLCSVDTKSPKLQQAFHEKEIQEAKILEKSYKTHTYE